MTFRVMPSRSHRYAYAPAPSVDAHDCARACFLLTFGQAPPHRTVPPSVPDFPAETVSVSAADSRGVFVGRQKAQKKFEPAVSVTIVSVCYIASSPWQPLTRARRQTDRFPADIAALNQSDPHNAVRTVTVQRFAQRNHCPLRSPTRSGSWQPMSGDRNLVSPVFYSSNQNVTCGSAHSSSVENLFSYFPGEYTIARNFDKQFR